MHGCVTASVTRPAYPCPDAAGRGRMRHLPLSLNGHRAERLVLRHRLGRDAGRSARACGSRRRPRRPRNPALPVARVPPPAPLRPGAVRCIVRHRHGRRAARRGPGASVPRWLAPRCQLCRLLRRTHHIARCRGNQPAGASLRPAPGGTAARTALRGTDRGRPHVRHHAVLRRDRAARRDGDACQHPRSRRRFASHPSHSHATHVAGDLSRLLRDELLEPDQHHDGCRLHRGPRRTDAVVAADSLRGGRWHGGARLAGGSRLRRTPANARRLRVPSRQSPG